MREIADRRALLVAALAAVLVKSREPEFAMIHAWLDSWSGLGAIVVPDAAARLRRDSDSGQPQAKGAELTMLICPLWAFDRRARYSSHVIRRLSLPYQRWIKSCSCDYEYSSLRRSMKRVLWLVELMAEPRSTDEWERRRHCAIVFTIVTILLAVLGAAVLVVAFDRAFIR